MDYKELRNELIKRTERYAEGVKSLYDDALGEIARLFSTTDYDPAKPFSFEDYGQFDKIDKIMSELERNIQTAIESDIIKEFGKSYGNIDELIKQVLQENTSRRVTNAFAPKISSGNAAKAYIKSIKDSSITASQRVWNGATLAQMETAMQDGLMGGMPAAQLATHLKEFLNEPDEYYRRFRIKTGESETGESIYGRKWKKRYQLPDGSYKWKDADPKDYPSGQGIYHSSYKNAMRYARTSTNIAYRTADYDRYQELPFVIGVDIRTSNNHPDADICDQLAGKYPPDFKWTGWHPNCRCYQVPLLASNSEVDDMIDEILDGRDPKNVDCAGTIEDLPTNFLKWSKKNSDRLLEASKRGNLPYFVKNNKKMLFFHDETMREAISIYDLQETFTGLAGEYKSGKLSIYEYVTRLQQARNNLSDVSDSEYLTSIDEMIDTLRRAYFAF